MTDIGDNNGFAPLRGLHHVEVDNFAVDDGPVTTEGHTPRLARTPPIRLATDSFKHVEYVASRPATLSPAGCRIFNNGRVKQTNVWLIAYLAGDRAMILTAVLTLILAVTAVLGARYNPLWYLAGAMLLVSIMMIALLVALNCPIIELLWETGCVPAADLVPRGHHSALLTEVTVDQRFYYDIVCIDAACPICHAPLTIGAGAPEWPRRIVGRCQHAPAEHVYSYDPASKTGTLLRPLSQS